MKVLIDLCGKPSAEWLDQYTSNEQINDRGIRIDREFAAAATRWKLSEQSTARDFVEKETGLRTLSGPKITAWVYEALVGDSAREAMHADTRTGLTLDQAARATLLDRDEGIQDPKVRKVVETIDGAQASSVSKYQTMSDRVDPEDDRVRGAFIFEGAGQTGRYSLGRRADAQPQSGDARRRGLPLDAQLVTETTYRVQSRL